MRHGWLRAEQELVVTQGVEIQRPSQLSVRIEGRAERPTGVYVGGSAVVVAQGHFRLQ